MPIIIIKVFKNYNQGVQSAWDAGAKILHAECVKQSIFKCTLNHVL